MTDTQPDITSIDAKPTRLIRIKQVIEITGLSKTTIYDLGHAGRFPKPVRLSEKAVAWVEAEINAWIEERIAARDAS